MIIYYQLEMIIINNNNTASLKYLNSGGGTNLTNKGETQYKYGSTPCHSFSC